METTIKKRKPFIDRLRVFVIFSLIPFHAAIIYLNGKSYISDKSGGFPVILCFMVFFLYHFFMDLLFFISGYSSFHSCEKRGLKNFLFERSKKLLIVFVAGFALICPVCAYFTGILHNGFKGNLISFYSEFMGPKIADYMGWGHFWFLLYLFIISIIFVPVLYNLRSQVRKISPGVLLILFLAGHLLIESLLRPFFPGNLMIAGDYANLMSYALSFICGWIVAVKKEYLEYISGKSRYFFFSGISGYIALCIIFFLDLSDKIDFLKQLSVVKAIAGFKPEIVAFSALTGLYAWSWILFWTGFGYKKMNHETRLLNFSSRYSFTAYIWHIVPITVIAFLIFPLKINAYIKWTIVSGIAFAVIAILLIILNSIKKQINTADQSAVTKTV
jgi:glucans biosynthesis protein C